MQRTYGHLFLSVSTLVLCTGCGSGGGQEAGAEGGTCYPNGTCNAGLDCLSNVCVNPSSGTDIPGFTDIYTDHGSGCSTNCGEMKTVPAGSFLFGCDEKVEGYCNPAKKAIQEVMLSEFKIDMYEVTVAQYRRCFEDGACSEPDVGGKCNWNTPGRDAHPINCIWEFAAEKYCEWAGKRLCTEPEWEKAARGSDGRVYPWGNSAPDCTLAVMNETEPARSADDGCGTGRTFEIGMKPNGASPYGLFDMSGNVGEIVRECDFEVYTNTPPDGGCSSPFLLRGGSFSDTSAQLRTTYRDITHQTEDHGVGLRCCGPMQCTGDADCKIGRCSRNFCGGCLMDEECKQRGWVCQGGRCEMRTCKDAMDCGSSSRVCNILPGLYSDQKVCTPRECSIDQPCTNTAEECSGGICI